MFLKHFNQNLSNYKMNNKVKYSHPTVGGNAWLTELFFLYTFDPEAQTNSSQCLLEVTSLLQVCALENTESVRLLMLSVFMEPGQLCNTYLPIVQSLVESLFMNITSLTDALFQAVIGDPSTYTVERPWYCLPPSYMFFLLSETFTAVQERRHHLDLSLSYSLL